MMSVLEMSADFVGMVGVVLVLAAFFYLNTHKYSALDIEYQFLNFFGSLCILYSLFFDWNLSAAIIEVAWIVISFVGILRCLKHNKR